MNATAARTPHPGRNRRPGPAPTMAKGPPGPYAWRMAQGPSTAKTQRPADPPPAAGGDAALIASLRAQVQTSNENCDRAMALSHRLSSELRSAQERVVKLEVE